MKKLLLVIAVCIIVLLVLLFVTECGGSKYPNPTSEYYINDFADALLPWSRQCVLVEGERLYEDTVNESEGGAQIVVATFLVESEEKVDEIDRTEIFREWKIGKNDMGILVLMIFCDQTDEQTEITDRVLMSTQIEIGYRMEQYLTASKAGELIDNCLYNPEWEGSLDMGLGELFYSLLEIVYTEAYGYESFTYDMEIYSENLIEYQEENEQLPMGFFAYLVSPYSSTWSKMFAMLALALCGVLGGGFILGRNKGGGGSSGGYGTRR